MEGFPKYALAERERRWRVDLGAIGPLADIPYRDIEDRYLRDTRLRLRRVSSAEGVVFKLGKKYGKDDGAEPITSIYLTHAEHAALAQLPAYAVRKRRYAIADGALDVYEAPLALAIFEREFACAAEAAAWMPPPFAVEEVTDRLAYSGFALAVAAERGG